MSNELPTIKELRRTMRKLSVQLYHAWKQELRSRLLDLEFEGYIAKDHINVHPAVWRLPNDEVRYALSLLQDDLENNNYEFDFRFDDVDEVNWVMFYAIELPERIEEGTFENITGEVVETDTINCTSPVTGALQINSGLGLYPGGGIINEKMQDINSVNKKF